MCAAQPWPLPLTHQLLETGKRLRDSANGEKMISRQQFMAVQTWMDEKETEEEGGGRGGFSRNEKLKPFFFQLFSEKDRKVDYTKMVGSYTAYNRGSYIHSRDLYIRSTQCRDSVLCEVKQALCVSVAVFECGQQCRAGAGQGSLGSHWRTYQSQSGIFYRTQLTQSMFTKSQGIL